jgi:hypothetical protein
MAADELGVDDLAILQSAPETLVLYDAANRVLPTGSRIERHFEYGAQRHGALLEEGFLAEELRAHAARLLGLHWLAALDENRFPGAQQLRLTQIAEQREQPPQGDAEQRGEDGEAQRQHLPRMSG